MIAPMKEAVLFTEIRWSKWLESVRKDVECTFGILKGRFRILKTGIRLHSIESIDQLWCTCCALHNMLLFDDGLAENWMDGARSDYLGDMGLHNPIYNNNIHVDYSGLGHGNDRIEHCDLSDDEESAASTSTNNNNNVNNTAGDTNLRYKVVRKLDYVYFRTKLIEHFDILFQNEQIIWPTRTGYDIPDI